MKASNQNVGGYSTYAQNATSNYGANANNDDANQYGNANQANNGNYDNANAQQNNGQRDLANYDVEVVDCDECAAMNCFDVASVYDDNGNQVQSGNTVQYWDADTLAYVSVAVDVETIAGWVSGISQCQQSAALFLDSYTQYSGFICNEKGTGVEIAMFLDEYCSIYNAGSSFSKLASSYDNALMGETSDLVTYAFLNDIDCDGDKTYVSHQTYNSMGQNYNWKNNNNNNNYGDASDFCTTVFDEAVSFRDCDGDGQQDEQNDDNVNQYAYNDQSDMAWFTYVLSYENSQDMASTCKVARTLDGEYTNVYQTSASGQIYNYGGSTSVKSSSGENMSSWFSKYYDTLDAALIAAIAVGAAVAITALACCLYMCCVPSSEPTFRRTKHLEKLERKRERLIDPSTGQIL
jgi:hypothetical protein